MRIHWAGIFQTDYIDSLITLLRKNGVDIVPSHDDFLRKEIPKDVPIHVHWLEAYGTDRSSRAQLKEALTHYGSRNPLIWTVHNLQPHHLPGKQGQLFYEACIPYFDHAIHLGPHSIEKIQELYPDAKKHCHHLCQHHVLPHQKESQIKPPWTSKNGVWITLGRLRNRHDKLLLEKYTRQGECEALYVHRYRHLIQRKWKFKYLRHPNVLSQEIRWRWFSSGIHLNFGQLTLDEMSAWIDGSERLLLPRTRNLNSGIPFFAAPFGVPIQSPGAGNISWQLRQLGYEQTGKDLYESQRPLDVKTYQEKTINQWVTMYRSIS
jgi:hypothetical protein